MEKKFLKFEGSVRQFLDVEAAVDDKEESAGSSELSNHAEFLDDQICDEESEGPGGPIGSSTQVNQDEHDKLQRLATDLQARYRTPVSSAVAQSSRLPVASTSSLRVADFASPSYALGPTPKDVPLWRVIVKAGEERNLTIRILADACAPGSTSSLRSVVARADLPRNLYVEAPNEVDIARDLKLYSDIFLYHPKLFVPPEERIDVLRYRSSNAIPLIAPGYLVRTVRFPYQGDLGVVAGVPATLTDLQMFMVMVIPRIDLRRKDDRSKGKRKMDRMFRPPKRLFVLQEVSKIYGDKAVERRNNIHLFRRHLYRSGLVEYEAPLHRLRYVDVNATAEEVFELHEAGALDAEEVDHHLQEISMLSLCPRTRVDIVSGQSKGLVGVIHKIEEGVAKIILESTMNYSGWEDESMLVDCLIRDLRRRVASGDFIKVRGGRYSGLQGWVVGHDINMVYFYPMGQPTTGVLSIFLSNTEPASPPALGGVIPSVPERLGHGFHRHPLEGRYVWIAGGHRKGHRAIIKDISGNGSDTFIEVEATRERINYPLADLFDPRRKEYLIPRLQEIVDHFDIPYMPSQESVLAASKASSSTPLPTPVTYPVSPAWDPGSQTPGPSPFPLEPRGGVAWFQAFCLIGKNFKVRIEGTKKGQGWEDGKHEGHIGLINVSEADCKAHVAHMNVAFQARTTVNKVVPCHFIQPLRPSAVKERVVIIAGIYTGRDAVVLEMSNPPQLGAWVLACTTKPKVACYREWQENLAIPGK